MSSRKVMITHILSEDLAFRHNARYLFETIESYAEREVVLDFTNVKTISRSFAHEYLSRKKKCSKNIEEVCVPETVEKMFKVVQNPSKKRKILDKDDSEMVLLN
ncbi:MAG: DUF4325 domain-containing protein [Candidatus Thorarchaeota archaeon]|nr:DUF4325 domain-containing protein [Candidatus Thorarchaeota archaeon]